MSPFDEQPVNILEQFGPIEKNGFNFNCSSYVVWSNGQCIEQGTVNSIISADYHSDEIHVQISDTTLLQLLKPVFSLSEVSENIDRLLWSKDLLNLKGATTKPKEPDTMSLFYKDGGLVKIALNLFHNVTLIELFTSNADKNEPKIETNNAVIGRFKNLLRMAIVDGKYENSEMKFINEAAKVEGITNENFKEIYAKLNDGLIHAPDTFLEKITQFIELKKLVFVDGKVSGDEFNLLLEVSKVFGKGDQEIEAMTSNCLHDLRLKMQALERNPQSYNWIEDVRGTLFYSPSQSTYSSYGLDDIEKETKTKDIVINIQTDFENPSELLMGFYQVNSETNRGVLFFVEFLKMVQFQDDLMVLRGETESNIGFFPRQIKVEITIQFSGLDIEFITKQYLNDGEFSSVTTYLP